MIPEWQPRVYILIYKQQAERKETETETAPGLGFGNLKAHPHLTGLYH